MALVWLSFPAGDSGGGPTNNDSLETETSVVNKTPTGPDRVQDGTAYFEYLAAIEAMSEPLPPGVEYPEGVPEGLDSGSTATGVLQSGAGANVAYFTWLCAWEAEYLNAVDAENAQRQVAAETMLAQRPGLGPVDDPQEGWAETVLEPLSFGDRSGLHSDFPQTCAQAGILNVNDH